ncbi:MAG TPA: hypothetical protein VK911_15655 [Vicinamibacterales bacterium]|nr:hypothetical protein [Vicinamibacterales bacterium]
MRQVSLVLALVALLVFLVVGDAPERTRFWEALFDFGHAPLSGAVALLLRGLVIGRDRAAHRASPGSASLQAFVAAVALVVAVEALQVFQPTRSPSWVDVGRNVAGAASFLLLAEAFAARRGGGALRPGVAARAAATVAAIALLAAAAAGLVRTAALYAARDRAFPTLFALDGSWWEQELISTGRSRLTPAGANPGAGGPAAGLARLDLRPGLHPGLEFDEPYPDWRGYRCLVLTIVSDLDAPLEMTIRVHDAAHDQRYHDRFNRKLTVRPGANRVVIPIADIGRAPDRREMDLRRVRGIILFAFDLDSPAHVYLGPLRLE